MFTAYQVISITVIHKPHPVTTTPRVWSCDTVCGFLSIEQIGRYQLQVPRLPVDISNSTTTQTASDDIETDNTQQTTMESF